MRTLNKKVLAAAVSTCLAVGSVATPAVAVFAKNINRTAATSISLADGSYTVDVDILKENADSASAAAGYFTTKDLKLEVKNGVATLKLHYSNPMIGGLAQIVDGTKETLPVLNEGTDNYVELTFNELKEAAYLYMEINTNSIFGIMKQTARVLIDETTVKKDGVEVTPVPEATTVPEGTEAPTATPLPTQTAAPTKAPEVDGTIKDGLYETNVYLWHANNDQASMAASALNGTARILVKNGTGTIYIYTKQMTMGTITAYLQELKVETSTGTFRDAKVEKKDAAGNPTCFSFTLPSFEEYVTIKVNPHVAMMGNQDIDARLKIDYKTLKEVKEDNLTEAPVETKAPSTTQTAKPTMTAKPSTPSASKAPETETEDTSTSTESTAAPSDTTGSTGTTWNDTEDVSEKEETDEESEEASEEAETEEESEETGDAEEALPQTGEATEQEKASDMKKAEVETEDNTVLVAAAAACAASFITSLLWTITIRFKKQ